MAKEAPGTLDYPSDHYNYNHMQLHPVILVFVFQYKFQALKRHVSTSS